MAKRTGLVRAFPFHRHGQNARCPYRLESDRTGPHPKALTFYVAQKPPPGRSYIGAIIAMETPIPNFYFMGIQFLHLLALSLWIGGIVVIQGVVIPILFQAPLSSQGARHLIGKIFLQFDRTTLFCAGALIATGLIKFWQWENLTPWNLIRYIAISIMSSLSLYTAVRISPKRVERLLHSQKEIQDESNFESRDRLDRLSVFLMRINLCCGMAALLMA